MYKRCEKPAPQTTIDLTGLGDPCDIYKNMLNKIDALRRLKAQWAQCDITRFDVQFQLADAMTYYFTIFDKANGERYEWSVRKEYTKESAEHAFERDYMESALRYNSGLRRALDDHLEALQEDSPDAFYRLQETTNGYRVWRPITGRLGVVPMELSFVGRPGVLPIDVPQHPLIWEYLGGIQGEAGRSLARAVLRMMKQGVVFHSAERTVVGDYRNITFIGRSPRNEQSYIETTMVIQEIDRPDGDLSQYHQYFTE